MVLMFFQLVNSPMQSMIASYVFSSQPRSYSKHGRVLCQVFQALHSHYKVKLLAKIVQRKLIYSLQSGNGVALSCLACTDLISFLIYHFWLQQSSIEFA